MLSEASLNAPRASALSLNRAVPVLIVSWDGAKCGWKMRKLGGQCVTLLASITPSIHGTKEKSCAARRSLCCHGDLQQCPQQPMAALGAPAFKRGSHTSHKRRLREKWVSGAS